MVRTGTIFEIPLSNAHKAYGQYVCKDRMGPIIQVFNLISKYDQDQRTILDSNLLFPPIITGLFAALRTGLWIPIGFNKIKEFIYPGFISTFENEKTGEASIWFYWDGKNSIRIGTQLPEEYKNKEYLMVWDPHDVINRIETGEYPFPYKDLILHNKYVPRK
jgi:hypothetical protein